MQKVFVCFFSLFFFFYVSTLQAQGTLYVSTTGNDGNSGTSSSPLKSVYQALVKASADMSIENIYVASGTYNETSILELRSNLRIEGSFNAGTWSKSASPTTININSLETINNDVKHKMGFRSTNDTNWILQDLVVTLPSATAGERASSGRGASVYGIYITGKASGNQLVNCSITVGNGGSGADGSVGASGAKGNNGSNGTQGGCANANGQGGGGGGAVGSGNRTGGAGGSGSRGGEGGFGGAAYDSNPGAQGTQGGNQNGGYGGGGGGYGHAKEDGNPGENGGNGPNGTLSPIYPNYQWSSYFTPSNQGNTGGNGYGGGGGGGGSGGGGNSNYSRGGGGGGGGSGGEGGIGGTGGWGGGGSFVIYCYNSATPEIVNCSLAKGTEGSGGAGGLGGTGGNGGSGGNGVGASSCSGKTGGNGAIGGKGGDGANGENGTNGTSNVIAFVNNTSLISQDIAIPIVRDKTTCVNTITILSVPGYGATTCRWYDTDQTTLLATTTTFSTSISANKTFYLTSYNGNSAYESSEKIPLSVILLASPSVPSASGDARCDAGTVNLTATVGLYGTTCRWYSDSNCTNLIHTGTTYSLFINADTTFFVTSFNEESACESNPIKVVGTIYPELSAGSIEPEVQITMTGLSKLPFLNKKDGSGGVEPSLYQWQYAFDNLLFQDIPNTDSISYLPVKDDNDTIYYRRKYQNACGIAYSNVVKVIFSTPLVDRSGIKREGEITADPGNFLDEKGGMQMYPYLSQYGEKIHYTPYLITNGVTNIEDTAVTCVGTIQFSGYLLVTEQGFDVSTDSLFVQDLTRYPVQIAHPLPPFPYSYSLIVNSLSKNTRYYVRSYAINTKGTNYGNMISFETDE